MGGIENAIYDVLSKKGWKRQILSTSFTAPISGTYYLNGVAAGAAGRVGTDTIVRSGGGSGESVTMLPVYLDAGTVVSSAIGAGGTGDGGIGGNTTFGSYLFLKGGGYSGANYLGGGRATADNIVRDPEAVDFSSSFKKAGARATSDVAAATQSTLADFPDGVKGGTYMFGGAGSKYAAGGAGNAAGAGAQGGYGAGGGSGTTFAGPGGDGYLEIMWQE